MEDVRVFKPQLGWTMILWLVLLILIGYDIVDYYIATDGDLKTRRIWSLVLCVAMIWAGMDDIRHRWVVCAGELEEWSGKKMIKSYSIERIAWVKVHRARLWGDMVSWRTWVIDIGFKDRSQTKSIEPLTVAVKDYAGFIEALKVSNQDIEVR
ncbi:MAG: hypothetical protein K2M76_02545 [Muribaculaceae bacterium]|nr:hypothetical protein [Muribaculaceae bacterium]